MPCVNKIVPLVKRDEKAIKFEVIQEEIINKKTRNPHISHQNANQIKWVKGNPSTNFSETVQLCCLKITPGPGTTFADYKIPEGAKCSICGSQLQKKRG